MKKILIIEDEESIVRALKDSLEFEGYEVGVAVNGEDAMDVLLRFTPDLILLDLLMPKKDGFYVLEEVKKNPQWKSIPIIVLSNFSRNEEVARATNMGARDYLIKSQNSIDEVTERIKKYM